MAKSWVLHTETKGTGAQMVPLESVQKRPASDVEPVFVLRDGAQARKPSESKPRARRRFRIVDVMTREVLVDGVSASQTVEALRDVRSVVDVNVYVWQEERDRWRPLTFAQTRTLLELAHRAGG